MNIALELLVKAALEERLAHLLLFHSGAVVERRQAGMYLAQALNCQRPREDGPCLECSACCKIHSGNHPDVQILQPQKASFGIEEILHWQEQVYRKHYEGKYKVYILEQADRLTLPAENALLKVIEEPPERTIIILSAQNAETLLPTIQSRAQAVYFPVIEKEVWIDSLDPSINRQEANEAFRLCGNDPDSAQVILELGVAKVKQWVNQFQESVQERDFLKVFNLFPIEKNEALIYLQVLAYQEYGDLRSPGSMLAINKTLDQIRKQANPRLAIEVLALELFRQGGY
ncbi:DNA polymerase III subunit delta' [Desulfitobacterium metallireducens]|uniref:DNA-directed DNA polymerase n=1 Tax=Desulfitobacterium metallireducens DSM 15288 TaxID=871968 RepID=W0E910_9FIRM|nr:DNA polymerase III subunit delta' [Desulfitobacterium metallireducens]AHF05689.1 DNA-directed DNA polymerase [Desulfitobacterium metallireducens DSM 15288]